ncbi:MAG: hypothetical protein HOV87_26015 [Catenulispora sp.]|nr:hypothetical protein [Catenulispora sp.]
MLFGGGSAAAGPAMPPLPSLPTLPSPDGASAEASRTPTALTWDAPAAGDEATRYLCAAAHVDAVFARRALREFVFDDGRAPAPAAGVDEILVLRHCLAARARRLHRDLALVALGVVALLVSVWTVAAWMLWGAGLRLLLSGAGMTPGPGYGQGQGYGQGHGHEDAGRNSPGLSSSVLPLARFAALVWGVGGGAFILAAAGLARPFGLRVSDAVRNVGPGAPGVSWLFVPIVGAGTAWLIVFVERVAARHILVDRLRRDRFATHRWVSTETVWARRALAELAAREASDRQVLADPARPFAGSGRQVLRRRWLLETGPIRYDVEDMIERVTDALAAGVPGLGPDGLLDAVVWDDFVVATGPVLAVGQTTDASLRLLPSPRGAAAPRVFRRFRIQSDPAETVVTAYLSASAAPGLALVEVHGLVLEPVAAAYRGVDRLPRLGVAAALVEGWNAAVTLPRLLFGAPAAAVGAAADPLRWRHRRAVLDRAAARGLPVAEGARTSLRELGVAGGVAGGIPAPLVDREGAPFAREDANLALAVVERRVREALRPLI